MQINDIAIVLKTKKFNDNSLIMKVITENNGIYSGLVRVKKNQCGFVVNITGNKLNLSWRARLPEHLGFFTTELNQARAHNIMKNKVFQMFWAKKHECSYKLFLLMGFLVFPLFLLLFSMKNIYVLSFMLNEKPGCSQSPPSPKNKKRN